MNKTTYLNELKEALKSTDETILQEIIADYEEHFRIGLQNGKSEEEICEDLGSIDDLAEEIKEVYGTDSKKNQKTIDFHFNIPDIDGEKIGGAINSALDSAGNAISKIDVLEIGHAIKSTWNQATSSINNFTDNYFKSRTQASPDSEKTNTQEYREKVSTSYDILGGMDETLIVDAVCADVIVRKSQDNKINIIYENKGTEEQKQLYEFYTYRKEGTVYAGIKRFGKGVFGFHLSRASISICVELPDFMNRIALKTMSGNICIEELRADSVVISTVSGKITVQEIVAENMKVSSISGNLEMDLEAKTCYASSKSGNITIKNINDLILEANSISGDVRVILYNSGNGYIVNSKTVSGSLDIDYSGSIREHLATGTYTDGNQGSELTVSTVSGNIYLTDS